MTHDSSPKHNCHRDGCTLNDPKAAEAARVPYRAKQPPAGDQKNEYARSVMAATKARHAAHGIEHNRAGCR